MTAEANTAPVPGLDAAVDSLDPAAWSAVRPAVHLVAQILGKVALAAHPFRNHWWECGLHLTPQGFRTPLLAAPGDGVQAPRFDLEVDVAHGVLRVRSSRQVTSVTLDESTTVADVYARVLALLAADDVRLVLDPTTSEIADPVRLDQDQTPVDIASPATRAWLRQLHAIDAAYAGLLQTWAGKTSGGILWWGALDYAVSLFNGEPNTPSAASNRIYRFGENAENITVSYWTDDAGHPELCAYRVPGDADDAQGDYGSGAWSHDRREVICRLTPRGEVAARPEAGSLAAFLSQTVRTLAANGGWDLPSLLGPVPAGLPGASGAGVPQ